MTNDLSDPGNLDGLLEHERPTPARRTWPLALVAFLVAMATVAWVAHAVGTWWAEDVYCGWFLC